MTRDIAREVFELVARHLSVDAGSISLDARIVQDLGADSLDAVELIMAIEESYDIEIPDEDAAKIHAVRDAIALVEQRLADRASRDP